MVWQEPQVLEWNSTSAGKEEECIIPKKLNILRFVEEDHFFVCCIKIRPLVAIDFEACNTTGWEMKESFGKVIGKIRNPVVVRKHGDGSIAIVQIVDHRQEIIF
jgi:hypothetical protein